MILMIITFINDSNDNFICKRFQQFHLKNKYKDNRMKNDFNKIPEKLIFKIISQKYLFEFFILFHLQIILVLNDSNDNNIYK